MVRLGGALVHAAAASNRPGDAVRKRVFDRFGKHRRALRRKCRNRLGRQTPVGHHQARPRYVDAGLMESIFERESEIGAHGQQLEDRRQDSEAFVMPQRERADIVISFCPAPAS